MGKFVEEWECELCGLKMKNVTLPVRHKCKSRGLGDTIAKFTKATGISAAVKAVLGDDCGCPKRQQALNEAVPYKND